MPWVSPRINISESVSFTAVFPVFVKKLGKFDEELETPRSAIVENYSNIVPKKIKICSTIRKPSRHKRTSEIETGNFSGWTTEKEKSVIIPEELEQKFQTVEPQESEIIFETNHFVFKEPKISCYQI